MLEFLTTSRVRSNLFGNKVPDVSSEMVDSSTWTSPRKTTATMMMKSRASKSLASPKTTCKSSNQHEEEKQEDVTINKGEFVVLCRAVVIKEFTPSPYDQNSLGLKVMYLKSYQETTFINYISQRQFK